MTSTNIAGKLSTNVSRMLIDENEHVYFNSTFNFLNAHNGFRKGNIHTFIGTSHGGKSTLIRSIIIDILCNTSKPKILLWLSEESRLEFLTEFTRGGFRDYEDNQLFIYSEMDDQSSQSGRVLSSIARIIKENKIDIVLYDNITTGELYMDKQAREQSLAVKSIKRMALNLNIPMIIVAHTGSNINDNNKHLIDMNDIRGSRTLTNVSQFFYIMQAIKIGEIICSTIRVVKHRGQEIENSIFRLKYAGSRRIYAADVPIIFADFKELYKKRDVL